MYHKVKNNSGDTQHRHGFIPADKWTTRDFLLVAKLSKSTLNNLRAKGVVNPEVMHMGQAIVYLYDDPDLEAVKEYKKNSSRRWVA